MSDRSNNAAFEELEQQLAAARAEAAAYRSALSETQGATAGSATDPGPALASLLAQAVTVTGGTGGLICSTHQDQIQLLAPRGDPGAAVTCELADSGVVREALRARCLVQRAQFDAAADLPLSMRASLDSARSAAALPLLRADKCLGVLLCGFATSGEIPAGQLAALQAFATHAALVLDQSRAALEALAARAREEASAEILRVIGSANGDLTPVFDRIVALGAPLLDANCFGVFVTRDGVVSNVAMAGDEQGRAAFKQIYPIAADESHHNALEEAGRRVLNVPQVSAGLEQRPTTARRVFEHLGDCSALMVPMVWQDQFKCTLAAFRYPPRPFGPQEEAVILSFADQCAIAIQNAQMFRETREALEHQTATADVLRVISSSLTSTQPVFDAIAERARSVSGYDFCALFSVDAEQGLHYAASSGFPPEHVATMQRTSPFAPTRGTVAGRAVLSGKIEYISNSLEESDLAYPELSSTWLSLIGVPLLQEGRVAGALTLGRRTPGAPSEKLLRLLQTFADQAVIAIQNANLFRETREALEHQTATSELLQIVGSSIEDPTPVYEKILDLGMSSLDANCFGIFTIKDGIVSNTGMRGDERGRALVAHVWPMPVDQSAARVIVSQRQVINVPNVAKNIADQPPTVQRCYEFLGDYSWLGAPLFWKEELLGALVAFRYPPRPFGDKEAAFLRGFADQAIIAMQNAKMFRETREALEEREAMAEVLEVISQSVENPEPVFDKILDSVASLIDGEVFSLFKNLDGETHLYACRGGEAARILQSFYPMPLEQTTYAITGPSVPIVHVPDTSAIPNPPPVIEKVLAALGPASAMTAPLRWNGTWVGSLSVARRPVRPFDQKEQDLLRTFADQAVIAIQNANLFRETQEALEHQTATADVLQVISNSPTSTQPVFAAIAEKARLVSGYDSCAVATVDAEQRVNFEASSGFPPEHVAMMRGASPFPATRGTVAGRAVLSGKIEYMTNAQDEGDFSHPEIARRSPSLIGVPLLHESRVVGTLTLARRTPGAPPEKILRLLQTFADQAVIAIQNARLFRETQEALELQTATSEILQIVGSSIEDPAPVYEKIVELGMPFMDANCFGVFLIKDGVIANVAIRGDELGRTAVAQVWPQSLEQSAGGLMSAAEKRVLNVPKVSDGLDEHPLTIRRCYELLGDFSNLAAPLVWDGKLMGAVSAVRYPPRPFGEKEEAFLRGFADQAIIAMQNAQMFRETREALEQQTAVAEVLSAISGSPSDLDPVLKVIAEQALKLIGIGFAFVNYFDGEMLHAGPLCSHPGFQPVVEYLEDYQRRHLPAPPTRAEIPGRAILDKSVVQILEATTDPDFGYADVADRLNLHSGLGVPIMRGDECLGAISVIRPESGQFPERQIALLKVFAEQAALAIDRVRLFKSTQEALEQQTAVAEVLSAIGSSPSDLGPVLTVIAEQALNLSGVGFAFVNYFDGELLHAGPLVSRPGFEKVVDYLDDYYRRFLPAGPTRAEIPGAP